MCENQNKLKISSDSQTLIHTYMNTNITQHPLKLDLYLFGPNIINSTDLFLSFDYWTWQKKGKQLSKSETSKWDWK